MASRRLVWLFFSLFLVSLVATGAAIFADRPALLTLALGIGAYALKDDVVRYVGRVRGASQPEH
jgi:hypothetical protein